MKAKRLFPRNLVAVNCEIREKLLQTDDCKIIVTTSGMGTYGPAQVYIPYFISKENALILLLDIQQKELLEQI